MIRKRTNRLAVNVRNVDDDDATKREDVKDANGKEHDNGKQAIVKSPAAPIVPERLNLTNGDDVAGFLRQVMPTADYDNRDPVAALVPWICEKLRSVHSRKAYMRDLATFFRTMHAEGISPLSLNDDHVRLYAAALLEVPDSTGKTKSPATVARVLSAIRGTYKTFARRGLIDMETALRIEAVESPTVYKNATPALTEAQACRLLHTPDLAALKGIRDHAILFCFFKTACRASALADALVGHLERDDTAYYLKVWEKRRRPQRKALLEAAPALLRYIQIAGIGGDLDGPLFRPLAKDRRSFVRRAMDRKDLWRIVKRYCLKADIDPNRLDGRGIGIHTLRKTALTNALRHGAAIQKVQALAGHSQISTTQLYYEGSKRDSDDAARHIQIR